MSKTSLGFLMVFAAGCPLLLIGLMGSVLGDCPRPITQFPATQAHCTVYISATAASLLLLTVGAAGIFASLVWQAASESKGVGRSA